MKKLAVVLVAGAALLAGCGGSSTGSSGSTSSAPPKPSGKVQVLYAASLENLMEKDLGNEYTNASGVSSTARLPVRPSWSVTSRAR